PPRSTHRAACRAAHRCLEHERLRRRPVPPSGWYGDGRSRAHAAAAAVGRLGTAIAVRLSTDACGDPGTQAPVALLGLRALQIRPGAPLPDDGPRLQPPYRRAAVLQRLRDAASAGKPVHGRARDLRRAPPE